ncbi:MAG TPA: methyltransferase domain-containing protein [Thermosynechococcaceae cyanobacterium]
MSSTLETPSPRKLTSRIKGLIKRSLFLTDAAPPEPEPVLPPEPEAVLPPPDPTILRRRAVTEQYLSGNGLEIGALHKPLEVPELVRVTYVDRLSVADLREQYPELAGLDLVEPDILDNGETLGTIETDSQDFVIANHFLEHCQDPIRTIANLLRVLKPEGILYMAVPDMRYTFDVHRPITDIAHILRDYQEGPEWSKRQHFRESVKFVDLRFFLERDISDEVALMPEIEASVDRYIAIDYSIHFHAWTQTEILELLQTLQRMPDFTPFEVELVQKNGMEIITVLRKASAPEPESSPELSETPPLPLPA